MKVPWTAERSNQSILKEINPKYSLEGLMLKLKLQYFDQLLLKSQLIGKDPDEKTEGKRRKGQERIRWLDTITNLMDTNLSEVCETVEDRGAWRVAVHGFAKS